VTKALERRSAITTSARSQFDVRRCSNQSGDREDKILRIVIIDDTGLRATVLEEGLREAGYDDIHVVPPRGAFVARLERMAPDVVLMDLGDPSRDTLEEMLVVSRALARPIAMFVDRSDEAMIGAATHANSTFPISRNTNQLAGTKTTKYHASKRTMVLI
jgi:CheY-like chemotaxis protein